MEEFKIFLLLLLYMVCCNFISEVDGSSEELVTKENIIKKIHESLGLANRTHEFITAQDFSTVLTKVGFKNCTKNPSKCSLCITLDALKQYNGLSPPIDQFPIDDVLDFSTSIIYFLSYKYVEGSEQNFGAVCNTSFIPLDNNTFDGVKQQHGGKSEDAIISEEVLESSLETLNDTVGYLLINQECFDVDDVFKGTNVSEDNVDAERFKLISAFILLKVLNTNCIKEHGHTESTLPDKGDFVGSLFIEYGANDAMSLENFKKLLQKLGVGLNSTDHDEHNHRKKRSSEEIARSTLISTRQRRAVVQIDKTKCYSPESLLEIYNIKSKSFNASQFTELCPSIVQQIESGACKTTATTTTTKKSENGWKPWVSSLVAVFIISIGSLAGIVVAPSSKSQNFKLLLVFLISLSVSTLLGDSILHLLPHSLNLHKHEEPAGNHDGNHESHNQFAKDNFIWKCLILIGGVYLFYLFEVVMHLCSPNHIHSHGTDEPQDSAEKGVSSVSHKKLSGQLELKSYKITDDKGTIVQVRNGLSPLAESTNPDDKQSIITKTFKKIKILHSVVFMILIGDAVHNFVDGVIIGVAFSEEFPDGFSGGISTSIAVLCHEIPHELGDFAVLVAAGISIPMALCLNFLSSLTAFGGAVVGILLGQQWDASPWIFAATAGLFIYIALVDLMPELLKSKELQRRPCAALFLQNLGLLIGFGIMFVLAAFEEKIKITI